MAAGFCLLAAVFCIAYVLTDQRRKSKKPVYAASGMLFIIATAVYIIAAIVSSGKQPLPLWLIYASRSGWLSIVIIILLVGAFVANVFADWRKNVK